MNKFKYFLFIFNIILFLIFSCAYQLYNPFEVSKKNISDSSDSSNPNSVEIPIMNPARGIYSSDQNVTISCSTSGAVIHYTTDGSTPGAGSPTYSVPISVAGHGTNMTIKAVGIKSGMADSTIASETYSINYYGYAAWGNSLNITINADTLGLGSDVLDFPLLVRLNTTNFSDIVTKTKSGGADIRFSKTDGAPLYYEIEDWVDNTSGAVWVLVDNISSSSQTTISMYYNNPGATSESNSNAVFDTVNNFAAVWHLNESPTDGTIGGHKDSTTNVNHATPEHFEDGDGGSTDASGNIGGADEFAGPSLDDYLNVPDHNSLTPAGDMTISFWTKLNTVGTGNDRLFMEKTHSVGPSWLSYQLYSDTDKTVGIGWVNSSTDEYYAESSTQLIAGNWYYIVAVHQGNNLQIYLSGSPDGSSVSTSGTLLQSDSPLIIGNDGSGNSIDGILDEVQISNTARSTDWIKLSFETQRADQTIVTLP